jgi:hypothetical protein
VAKGIYVSPGIYRDPKTGKTYRSTSGNLPGASAPRAKTTKTTGTANTATPQSGPFFQNPGPEFIKGMEGISKSPQGTIGGQIEANQYVAGQNINANRPNYSTSQGNESWTQNPDGTFTRSYAESQPIAQIRSNAEQGDIQTGATMQSLGQMAQGNLANPYSLAGAPKIPGEGDRIAERQRIENALMNRFNERQNPEFDRQNANIRQQLADEGQAPGSKGYEVRMKQLMDQQEGVRRDYNVSALQLGGSEMTRTADLAGADYDRYKAGYDAQRYAPINEMAALGQANATRPRVADYQFNPMATVDFGGIDVGGTVKSYWDNQNAKAAIAKSGGGGGGGGSESTTGIDNQLLGLLGPSGNAPQGQSPTNSFVGGLGSGLGAGLTISGTQAAGRRNTNAFMRQ